MPSSNKTVVKSGPPAHNEDKKATKPNEMNKTPEEKKAEKPAASPVVEKKPAATDDDSINSIETEDPPALASPTKKPKLSPVIMAVVPIKDWLNEDETNKYGHEYLFQLNVVNYNLFRLRMNRFRHHNSMMVGEVVMKVNPVKMGGDPMDCIELRVADSTGLAMVRVTDVGQRAAVDNIKLGDVRLL
jgi:hypothetical protein